MHIQIRRITIPSHTTRSGSLSTISAWFAPIAGFPAAAWTSYTAAVLFMVVERFKDGSGNAAGERFRRLGRMLPDGVAYHASWMEPDGSRCFQLMEAPARDALDPWTARWNDLVDFEIVAILRSTEYWAQIPATNAGDPPRLTE